LVDPLDGTKDFIAKNGEFTINIALLKKCMPVLGIIYAPAINEIYYAEKEKAAFLIKNGQNFKLPQQRCKEFIMARSRFHDVSEIDQFAIRNSIFKSNTIGSALKFGRLARGDINIYPRFTGSKEWDIAAGHIIIKEAGCKIVDLVTLAEPVYNKPDVKNNFFIAHSREVKFEDLCLDGII
jgi:3'(2'), 5'-bisphosphate nucleotidase